MQHGAAGRKQIKLGKQINKQSPYVKLKMK